MDNYFKGHRIKSTTDRADSTFLDLADGPLHYVQVDLKGVIVGTNTSILPSWGEPPRLVARTIASWQVTHTSESAIRQGRPLGHYVIKTTRRLPLGWKKSERKANRGSHRGPRTISS